MKMARTSTDTEPDAPAEASRQPSKLRVVWEYVSTLGLMALVVFSARSSLADWYEVPSGSMLPTIQLGDRIFVNKLAYDLRIPFTSISLKELGTPQRGDIVVFLFPLDNHTDYVKRLVGLPGDTIAVRNEILYINGQEVSRRPVSQDRLLPGARHRPSARLYIEQLGDVSHFVFESRPSRKEFDRWGAPPDEDYGPRTIPEDMYFMMGDNRDNSSDSRRWGFVPRKNLRGRALRVVLSFDPDEPLWSPKKIRIDRLLSPLDPRSES